MAQNAQLAAERIHQVDGLRLVDEIEFLCVFGSGEGVVHNLKETHVCQVGGDFFLQFAMGMTFDMSHGVLQNLRNFDIVVTIDS